MFENDQDTVDELLISSSEFRRLYDKHAVLKTRVQDATGGSSGADQLDIEALKKEKLSLKDKMADIIKTHHGVCA